jgi:mono/diheme cytochrome c family protein
MTSMQGAPGPAPMFRRSRPRHGWACLATGLSAALWLVLWLALGLGGCAVEVQNTQPAREATREQAPPGSPYAGWRVYQDKCAACHGDTARGSAQAPDLLARMAGMGPARFVNLVLRRYDWHLPAARDTAAEEVLQRRLGTLAMPAWQGEPAVNAHILDLYAYLAARSEGTLGPGRPQP